MRRALLLPLAATLLLAPACGGSAPAPVSGVPAPRAASAHPSTPTPIDTATPSSPAPTPSPTTALPPGVPASYAHDVPSGDVPLKRLIPPGATPDGSWYASTPAGDAILVAFAMPSSDPFRAARGFVVWRHFPQAPPWRALHAQLRPEADGVLSIQALAADLTGDGSPDALVEELTGGSGACGTFRAVDLAGGVDLWHEDLCDARVLPSSDPVGIEITQAVFKPGDAHCCPSASRTTVLTYAGNGRWTVASRVTTPTGG